MPHEERGCPPVGQKHRTIFTVDRSYGDRADGDDAPPA
jgi:hypothetical protein